MDTSEEMQMTETRLENCLCIMTSHHFL